MQGSLLLADSHPPMLAGVRSLLEGLFEVVVMVADEASLIAAIHRMRPDVVIVDLSLPASGGANVARRLTREFAGLKVIVLSVHDESTAVHQVLAAGVAGFVLKRTAATDLVEAVRAVLGGGTYVSPAAGSLTVIEGSPSADESGRGFGRGGRPGPMPALENLRSGSDPRGPQTRYFRNYPKTGYRA